MLKKILPLLPRAVIYYRMYIISYWRFSSAPTTWQNPWVHYRVKVNKIHSKISLQTVIAHHRWY